MPRTGIDQVYATAASTGRYVHHVTPRHISAYADREGDRAGERYMRLRLFDRIRRLTRRRAPARRPDSDFSGGAQGRHRRGRPPEPPESPEVPSTPARSDRGSPGPAPWSTSSAPPAALAPPPRPMPDGPSFAGADGFAPSGTSLGPGPPAVPGQWPG